jgi:hypothetical protein
VGNRIGRPESGWRALAMATAVISISVGLPVMALSAISWFGWL